MQPAKYDAHHLQLDIFAQSHINAIKYTVPLKYNRPTDSLNAMKCAKVQLHPQW